MKRAIRRKCILSPLIVIALIGVYRAYGYWAWTTKSIPANEVGNRYIGGFLAFILLVSIVLFFTGLFSKET